MINTISFPNLNLSFEINRAAITIGNFSIYWYGILIALGIVLALVYAYYECKRINFDTDHVLNMLLLALPTAIICARAYYVIFNFNLYKADLAGVFEIRNGGLAIYGGIIGTVAVIFFYCRGKKLNIGTVLDILSVGLLIGQAVGRWGNFVNGEAFGSSTALPFAMSVERNGELVASMVHPTFLYESLWNIAGIAVLLIYKKFKSFEGELFCGYMVWYGIGRAMIEGLRADSLYIGSLRVSQILSIALVIAGITVIIYNRKFKKSIGHD